MKFGLSAILFFAVITNCWSEEFDVLIKGGTVYDGTGGDGRRVDVALKGDRISKVGDLKNVKAAKTVDAAGLAVAPGFINMLSWSNESLIQDGHSQSEIRQGVTTEIMGEGESMGPVNDRVREHMIRQQTDIKYDITWSTLSDYLHSLQQRGISCNVASFIGATTIRQYVIGFEDKAPTPEQLDEMRRISRPRALGYRATILVFKRLSSGRRPSHVRAFESRKRRSDADLSVFTKSLNLLSVRPV